MRSIGAFSILSISPPRAMLEPPALEIPRLPDQTFEQITHRHVKGTRELEDGVGAGDPQPALKLADLGAVQSRTPAQLLLGEIGTLATASEVVPENAP